MTGEILKCQWELFKNADKCSDYINVDLEAWCYEAGTIRMSLVKAVDH